MCCNNGENDKPVIDRDAVVKTFFCILFSIMALGFFISWMLRCNEDPNEDVGFEKVIYSWARCSEFDGQHGWAVPALAYAMFHAWNIIWSVLCLVFLIIVAQCSVRIACTMLVLGTSAIVIMDVISIANTWNNQDFMFDTYPKSFRTHQLWQIMFLQLTFGSAQCFLYVNSIWDAWFRNNADSTFKSVLELQKNTK